MSNETVPTSAHAAKNSTNPTRSPYAEITRADLDSLTDERFAATTGIHSALHVAAELLVNPIEEASHAPENFAAVCRSAALIVARAHTELVELAGRADRDAWMASRCPVRRRPTDACAQPPRTTQPPATAAPKPEGSGSLDDELADVRTELDRLVEVAVLAAGEVSTSLDREAGESMHGRALTAYAGAGLALARVRSETEGGAL